eukprot:573487-Pelagomonas_calceolata.AAC.3
MAGQRACISARTKPSWDAHSFAVSITTHTCLPPVQGFEWAHVWKKQPPVSIQGFQRHLIS